MNLPSHAELLVDGRAFAFYSSCSWGQWRVRHSRPSLAAHFRPWDTQSRLEVLHIDGAAMSSLANKSPEGTAFLLSAKVSKVDF